MMLYEFSISSLGPKIVEGNYLVLSYICKFRRGPTSREHSTYPEGSTSSQSNNVQALNNL